MGNLIMSFRDISGFRFGRLVAINRIDGTGRTKWECVCDCGNKKITTLSQLSSGKTSSCGCLRSENAIIRSKSNSTLKTSRSGIAKRIIESSIPEPNSGCWLWEKSLNKSGYGHTAMGKGKTMIASRLSFYAFVGDLSDMVVMHKCDNKICVNPDHLVLGTQKDNIADMFSKGRARPRGVLVAPK